MDAAFSRTHLCRLPLLRAGTVHPRFGSLFSLVLVGIASPDVGIAALQLSVPRVWFAEILFHLPRTYGPP